jgi:hypothetical protein
MFLALLYKLFFFSFGVALVALVRFIYDLVSARLLLRPIPGPTPSSYIWGEEWKLYSRPPGELYTDWHKQYGSIVKFRGAFGVCFFDICRVHSAQPLISFSIKSFL